MPLEALAAGAARLALSPAVSGFTAESGRMVRDDRFEAVAAIGSTFLHALTLSEQPVAPVDARTIASGPEGSASHRLASVIAKAGEADATVLPLADESAQTAAEALRSGTAESAVMFAVPGRVDLVDLLASTDDITLVNADGWWQSPARLVLPVMREAQINGDTYPGIDRPIRTLSTQLILFGPAASDRFVIGQQGPNAFFDEPRPLQDRNIEAINRNLGLHAAVDPYLRRAAALTPQVNIRDDRINPYPGRAILMIVILAYLVWAGWLLARPEPRQKRR
nr:TAXI family TRAP transporter solute-binding subunit [Marinicella sp. W31]MDC2878901.1 TAXI family TRAP transporter solute-binding subunit [Marinicella sp. W31]